MPTSGIVLDIRNLADLYDDSRNHHTITNHNAIPVRGMHGRGMEFNGINTYLDCGNHSSLNITDAITIEAWVNPGAVAAGPYVFLSKGTYDTQSFYLDIYSNQYRWSLGTITVQVGGTPVVGEWQCVVITGNGTTGKLYVNAKEIGSDTYTDMIDTTFKTRIGCRDDGTTGIPVLTQFFNGIISSTTLSNYALSADTIKLHYRQQSPYYQEEAPTICL